MTVRTFPIRVLWLSPNVQVVRQITYRYDIQFQDNPALGLPVGLSRSRQLRIPYGQGTDAVTVLYAFFFLAIQGEVITVGPQSIGIKDVEYRAHPSGERYLPGLLLSWRSFNYESSRRRSRREAGISAIGTFSPPSLTCALVS